MSTFKRPNSLIIPRVYTTFEGNDITGDKIIEYRIQDLPEEYFDQAVDFMIKYFLPDETLGSAYDITSKPGAIQAFRDLWHESLRKKLSIGCFRDDKKDELVGLNVLVVKTEKDLEGFGKVSLAIFI